MTAHGPCRVPLGVWVSGVHLLHHLSGERRPRCGALPPGEAGHTAARHSGHTSAVWLNNTTNTPQPHTSRTVKAFPPRHCPRVCPAHTRSNFFHGGVKKLISRRLKKKCKSHADRPERHGHTLTLLMLPCVWWVVDLHCRIGAPDSHPSPSHCGGRLRDRDHLCSSAGLGVNVPPPTVDLSFKEPRVDYFKKKKSF